MEQNLNIAEILKDKPIDLKLYSSTFGYIKFNGVHKDKIYFSSEDTNVHSVKPNGKMYDSGECVIFPSKEMQDWSKFQWEKGDVLISNDGGTEVIFDKWYDDTYTNFYGKHYLNSEDKNNIKYSENLLCTTERYSLEDKNTAQTYINIIEKHLGGKLNLKTLEIEKGQPEFKDGDIVVAEENNYYDKVIFIATIKDDIVSKALINVRYEDYEVHYNEYRFGRNRSLRLATDSEKQQLFDALAKEGKRWDIEKKQIVDLKLKWTPKPFDKVVVRCGKADKWSIDFFSYKVSNGYICTGDAWFGYCLPYNEETAKLIGTTNNVEG